MQWKFHEAWNAPKAKSADQTSVRSTKSTLLSLTQQLKVEKLLVLSVPPRQKLSIPKWLPLVLITWVRFSSKVDPAQARVSRTFLSTQLFLSHWIQTFQASPLQDGNESLWFSDIRWFKLGSRLPHADCEAIFRLLNMATLSSLRGVKIWAHTSSGLAACTCIPSQAPSPGDIRFQSFYSHSSRLTSQVATCGGHWAAWSATTRGMALIKTSPQAIKINSLAATTST